MIRAHCWNESREFGWFPNIDPLKVRSKAKRKKTTRNKSTSHISSINSTTEGLWLYTELEYLLSASSHTHTHTSLLLLSLSQLGGLGQVLIKSLRNQLNECFYKRKSKWSNERECALIIISFYLNYFITWWTFEL